MLLLLIIFFDWNRLLEYILLVMIIVALWLNPIVKRIVWELIVLLQLRHFYELALIAFKFQNQHYVKPHVRSISEVNRAKLLEKFELKMKKKRSLYSKYKRLLEVLFFIQQGLTKIAENFEKLKNLLNWTHKRKTAYFIAFGSVAFIVLTYFPIRLFMVVGLLYTMNKNKYFYPLVYSHNKAVIM
jgi:hypothetical protein